jgi:hypothetical protein
VNESESFVTLHMAHCHHQTLLRHPLSKPATPIIILICSMLWSASPVHAMETRDIHTEYVKGEYRLVMDITLAARADRVENILRNYANYHALDSRILEARVIQRPQPNVVQLFTRIRVCFSFLCRNVDRMEQVEERPFELLATVIPDKSDAERGSTHTVLIAEGDHTRVQYTTSIVPKFWVPALFGRNVMLHSLRDATTSMFEHIEKQAQ